MNISQWYLMRKSKDFKSNVEMKQSPLEEVIEKGEGRKVLYHYTNIDSLFKILESMMFKFSRIDKVNDLMEKKKLILLNMYKRVFVACFNHREDESIPLWKIYTNRGSGIRIGLFFKDDQINSNFVDYNRSFLDSNNQEIFNLSEDVEPIRNKFFLTISDVYYTDEAYMNHWFSLRDNQIDITPDDFAYSKSREWEYEEETRLILFHRDLNKEPLDTDYILIPINFSQLDSIEVRYDPWMSTELRECYKKGLEKYEDKWKIKIKSAGSELMGKIS